MEYRIGFLKIAFNWIPIFFKKKYDNQNRECMTNEQPVISKKRQRLRNLFIYRNARNEKKHHTLLHPSAPLRVRQKDNRKGTARRAPTIRVN